MAPEVFGRLRRTAKDAMMTLTFVLTVLVVWFLASLAAALLVARMVRGKRQPSPTDKNGAADIKRSLQKTA